MNKNTVVENSKVNSDCGRTWISYQQIMKPENPDRVSSASCYATARPKHTYLASIILLLGILLFVLPVYADNEYLIVYNLNGGSGYAPSVHKTQGVPLQITNQTPWKNPMTFMGWSTDPDALEGEYLPNDEFTVDANTTLYAIWRDSFNPGILTDGSQFVVPSYHLGYRPRMYVRIVVDSPGFYSIRSIDGTVSPGWGGDGFYDASLNIICEYDYIYHYREDIDNDGVPDGYNDVEACAWLNANTVYYFAYMDHRDTDAIIRVIKTQDSALDVGCIDGEGDIITNYSPNNNTSLFISFTVSEDGYYNIRSTNGGEDDYHSETNQLFLINANGGITRIGDAGWTIDGRNLTITANLQANVTYYLKYFDVGHPLGFLVTNEIFTLTYNLNGGMGYAPAVSKLRGETIRITNQVPWLNPMTFMGWNTDPSAESGQYLPGDPFEADVDTTLYAIWSPAFDPGTLYTGITITVPSFHLGYGPRMYVMIRVDRSGYYCIRSLNGTISSGWGGEGFLDDHLRYLCDFECIWTIGEDLDNDGVPDGYNDLAAYYWLEAGTLYYYAFMDRRDVDAEIVCILTQPAENEAEMELPSDIMFIEEGAFQGNSFSSVLIPDGTITISPNAFADCLNLREVIVLSPYVDFDDNSFANCNSLTFVGYPNSTTAAFAQQHGFVFRELSHE